MAGRTTDLDGSWPADDESPEPEDMRQQINALIQRGLKSLPRSLAGTARKLVRYADDEAGLVNGGPVDLYGDEIAVFKLGLITTSAASIIVSAAYLQGTSPANRVTGRLLVTTSGGPVAIVLANDAPVGAGFSWVQGGAGQITFSAGSGATIIPADAFRKSGGLGYGGSAIVIQNDGGASAQWWLTGRLVE